MPPALLLIASAGLLGAMLAMRPASAQNSLAWELCAGNGDPPRELQASACNLVIQSGKPAPANLAHAHRARALAYLANRQSNRAFLEAIKQYDQALARDAKMILEWFFRDALDLHDYDRAIANFSRQILLDSTIDWPWYFRGVAHLGKKDYNSAISDFDAALRIKVVSQFDCGKARAAIRF